MSAEESKKKGTPGAADGTVEEPAAKKSAGTAKKTAAAKKPTASAAKKAAKAAPKKAAAPETAAAKKAAPKKAAPKKAAPKKAAPKKAAATKEVAATEQVVASPQASAAEEPGTTTGDVGAAAKSQPAAKPAARKSRAQQLRITQVRSQIGFPQPQRLVLRGLGLGRIGRTVIRPDDPCIRGMVAKVTHLVAVEEVEA